MFLMFLHFTEAATSICLLKKVFTTRHQKALDFFQRPWLLIIINFIDEQLFAEHRFLKNTYAWLLLTSKFYSELDSCSVTTKFAEGIFPVVCKMTSFAEIMKQPHRDWINNFPCWIFHLCRILRWGAYALACKGQLPKTQKLTYWKPAFSIRKQNSSHLQDSVMLFRLKIVSSS